MVGGRDAYRVLVHIGSRPTKGETTRRILALEDQFTASWTTAAVIHGTSNKAALVHFDLAFCFIQFRECFSIFFFFPLPPNVPLSLPIQHWSFGKKSRTLRDTIRHFTLILTKTECTISPFPRPIFPSVRHLLSKWPLPLFMTQQRLTYKSSFPFLYYVKSTIRFCLTHLPKAFLSSLYSHVCQSICPLVHSSFLFSP